MSAYLAIGIIIVNNFAKLCAAEEPEGEAMWELTAFLKERSVQ